MNTEKPYELHFGDCVKGMADSLLPDSIDLCVTSIPFGALFLYSGKTEDVGNNHDGVEMEEGPFGLHLSFWAQQLFRVLKPGCNVCIHIQQLLAYQNQHGWMGRRDFRNAVIYVMKRAGFVGAFDTDERPDGMHWTGEIVIPKNPQAMAQRLSLHSLMFVTGKRNSRRWAPAVNDYILVFQKPGESERACQALYDAAINPNGWVTTEQWINWAEGLWSDIVETDVLDGYRSARETDEERHVCPLQLSVILRLVSMYSAPGELVLDPFGGIGSTPYICMRGKCHEGRLRDMRRSITFELKESYHALSIRNLQKLEAELAEEKNDLFQFSEARHGLALQGPAKHGELMAQPETEAPKDFRAKRGGARSGVAKPGEATTMPEETPAEILHGEAMTGKAVPGLSRPCVATTSGEPPPESFQ